MNTLDIGRFGLAFGVACAVAYVLCVATVEVVPEDTVIRISNTLMHGVDVESIMRSDVPLWEAFVGAIGTFVLASLFGMVVAATYNFLSFRKSNAAHPED